MISAAAARSVLRHSRIRFLACAAALAVAGLLLVVTHPRWWPVSLATLLAVPLAYHLTIRDGPRAVGAWRAADPKIRRLLERLDGDGFHTLEGVDVGRERIHHVVAGRTGVYSLRTDTTPGKVVLGRDGWLRRDRDRDEIGELVWQATREAMALKARLREAGVNVPVQAIVALTAATLPNGPVDMGKALFLDAADVAAFIRSRKTTLSSDQIDRVAEAMARDDSPRRRHPSGRAR